MPPVAGSDVDAMLARLLALAALVGLALVATWLGGLLIERRRQAALGDRLPAELRALVPAGRPGVLYFSGPRCAECRARQRPALERLRAAADLALVEIDVEVQPDLARRLGILTVPSTAVVSGDGRLLALNSGFAPAERLAAQAGAGSEPVGARPQPSQGSWLRPS